MGGLFAYVGLLLLSRCAWAAMAHPAAAMLHHAHAMMVAASTASAALMPARAAVVINRFTQEAGRNPLLVLGQEARLEEVMIAVEDRIALGLGLPLLLHPYRERLAGVHRRARGVADRGLRR